LLVYRPIQKKGRLTKFLHRYFSPYKIVRWVSDLNYIVKPLCGQRKKQDCVHQSHLKPFRLLGVCFALLQCVLLMLI
jgi:hypothetical protein